MTGVSVKDSRYHPLFITMCPTYAFIDRADGKFNRAMDFKKDYSALIAAAWDIDTAYDQFLSNCEAEHYDILKRMGLDDVENSAAREKREQVFRMLLSGKVSGTFRDRYVDPFGFLQKNAT